jgi:hypothetical protein
MRNQWVKQFPEGGEMTILEFLKDLGLFALFVFLLMLVACLWMAREEEDTHSGHGE